MKAVGIVVLGMGFLVLGAIVAFSLTDIRYLAMECDPEAMAMGDSSCMAHRSHFNQMIVRGAITVPFIALGIGLVVREGARHGQRSIERAL
jgi:hypothetical protein